MHWLKGKPEKSLCSSCGPVTAAAVLVPADAAAEPVRAVARPLWIPPRVRGERPVEREVAGDG